MATGLLDDVGNSRLITVGTPHSSSGGITSERGDKLAREIIKRQQRLEAARKAQDRIWNDVDNYATARRAHYDIGSASGDSEDEPAGASIYDGTATQQLHDFADGWQAQTANALVKWWAGRFRNRQLRSMYDAKRWMDSVEEALAFEMANSNFYEQLNEAFQDGTSHGIATMVGPEWNPKKSKFYVLERHPREIFISVNYLGEVDIWHRKFKINGRQIVGEFGIAHLPERLKESIRRNPYRQYVCIHAIFERTERDVTSPLSTDMPWASVFVLPEYRFTLHEGGLTPYDLPDTWRWSADAVFPYGTCPAIEAIYDVMATNAAFKAFLESAQLSIQPPLIVTEQMAGRVQLTPLGETVLKGPQDKVQAFEFPSQFQVGMAAIAQLREALSERFKAKIFQMQSEMGGKITMFQSNLIQGEKIAALVPVTTRASSQMLVPKVNKFFHAAARAGRLEPPPASVMQYLNSPVDVEMVGPIATGARRFLSQQGINAFIGFLGELGKVSPKLAQAVADTINPDELRKIVTDSDGTPQKLFYTDEQIAQMRQMAAEAQQRLMQQNALGQLADMYHKATAAPEQGSPAEALMGGGQ